MILDSTAETYVVIILIFIFLILPLIIFLFIFAYKRNTPEAKGKRGEEHVNQSINCISDYHKIIRNLLIPTSNGRYTEIDSVLITQKGIFCIEIKNLGGYLYGDSSSKYWTQVLSYGRVKNSIYNPVLQNDLHVRTLKKVFHDKFEVHNVVILDRHEGGKISSNNVYTSKSFLRYYKNIKEVIILSSQVDSIYQILSKYISTPEQREAHARRVRIDHHNK